MALGFDSYETHSSCQSVAPRKIVVN